VRRRRIVLFTFDVVAWWIGLDWNLVLSDEKEDLPTDSHHILIPLAPEESYRTLRGVRSAQ